MPGATALSVASETASYFTVAAWIWHHEVTLFYEEPDNQATFCLTTAAYYGLIKKYFMKYEAETQEIESVSAETSLAIQRILENHWKVDFWIDEMVQKSAINETDDFFYNEVKDKFDMALSLEQMDKIIEKTMQIAKSRRK